MVGKTRTTLHIAINQEAHDWIYKIKKPGRKETISEVIVRVFKAYSKIPK